MGKCIHSPFPIAPQVLQPTTLENQVERRVCYQHNFSTVTIFKGTMRPNNSQGLNPNI